MWRGSDIRQLGSSLEGCTTTCSHSGGLREWVCWGIQLRHPAWGKQKTGTPQGDLTELRVLHTFRLSEGRQTKLQRRETADQDWGHSQERASKDKAERTCEVSVLVRCLCGRPGS